MFFEFLPVERGSVHHTCSELHRTHGSSKTITRITIIAITGIISIVSIVTILMILCQKMWRRSQSQIRLLALSTPARFTEASRVPRSGGVLLCILLWGLGLKFRAAGLGIGMLLFVVGQLASSLEHSHHAPQRVSHSPRMKFAPHAAVNPKPLNLQTLESPSP